MNDSCMIIATVMFPYPFTLSLTHPHPHPHPYPYPYPRFNNAVPLMRSAEYQATIPLKFVIIFHDYANI